MTDIRTDIRVFGEVLARVSDPYLRPEDVLAEYGLDAAAWADVTAAWEERLREDSTLVRPLELAITRARGGADQESSETLFVQPDEAARAALREPALPFQQGVYVPQRVQSAAPTASDPEPSLEETLLPFGSGGQSWPFKLEPSAPEALPSGAVPPRKLNMSAPEALLSGAVPPRKLNMSAPEALLSGAVPPRKG
ncbi:MAG: hypothetical protein U0414_05340 [Polyangiaceae bacterium]